MPIQLAASAAHVSTSPTGTLEARLRALVARHLGLNPDQLVGYVSRIDDLGGEPDPPPVPARASTWWFPAARRLPTSTRSGRRLAILGRHGVDVRVRTQRPRRDYSFSSPSEAPPPPLDTGGAGWTMIGVMETTSAPRLYSCDDHLDLWNLPRDVWEDRLPARLRERGPRVVESSGSAWWTCDGAVIGMYGLQGPLRGYSAISRAGIDDDGLRASNPKLRLDDMDRDGVWASVVYGPNLFGLPIQDPELKAAALAAYNDWAAEFNRHEPARLSVLPVLPTHAPQAAAAELERVARAAHRGAIISPFEFRCSDPEWEGFWDVATEVGLPISFHIGQGTSQVRVAPGSWELAAFSAVGPMQLDEPLAMMIYSGVLERHPTLRLVLAESGIGWLPYFVHRLDAAAEKHVDKAQDYRITTKPSELFRRQVYATFEEEPLGPELLPLLGPDNFMWASDYPHPDSTFPHSRAAIAHAFRGLDPDFVERVTATNCKRLYGFA